MQLDEVLPEVMGSLVLSELLFRGEGPPCACSRMDQYQRKMRKPAGGEGQGLSRLAAASPHLLPPRVTSTQICPLPSSGHRLWHRCDPGVTYDTQATPTLEGGHDAEEVEDNKLEGAGSKGEEDQGPGQAEDQAEAQQRQHVGPLLGVRMQPQDLYHHRGQHGRVEQKHQAEEAQVGDVADQGVPDPAPVDQDGGSAGGGSVQGCRGRGGGQWGAGELL